MDASDCWIVAVCRVSCTAMHSHTHTHARSRRGHILFILYFRHRRLCNRASVTIHHQMHGKSSAIYRWLHLPAEWQMRSKFNENENETRQYSMHIASGWRPFTKCERKRGTVAAPNQIHRHGHWIAAALPISRGRKTSARAFSLILAICDGDDVVFIGGRN